jgi:hypothetical protein
VLSNLQLLRAFAAINVVAFHTIIVAAIYKQDTVLFSYLSGWGRSGVDLFFVISGFVMVYAQHNSPKSALCFLKHRVIRIVPMYWVLTAAMLTLFWMLPSIFNHSFPSFESVASSFLFVSQLVTDQFPVFFVGWTLEYEMLFYLLFALGVLFVKTEKFNFVIPAVFLAFFVGIGLADWVAVEFIFGMLVARAFIERKFASFGAWFLLMGVTLLGSTAFFNVDETYRSLVWGVPAIFIVFGAVLINQTKSRVLKFFGDASYSIYLVQVFTISAFYKFASKFLSFVHGDLLFILSLTLSVLFGCLVYALVEKPVTIFLNKKFGCVK